MSASLLSAGDEVDNLSVSYVYSSVGKVPCVPPLRVAVLLAGYGVLLRLREPKDVVKCKRAYVLASFMST